MAKKKCECMQIGVHGINIGNIHHTFSGKEMDALYIQSDIAISPTDDDSYEMYAEFHMNGANFYSKSIFIKYCPFCGRKL